MQRYSTGCRLLLITPVLFILLQVAMALHHHHFQSYHDDKDSLHSVPVAFHSDHEKRDILTCLLPEGLLNHPSLSLWISNPDNPKMAFTVLITDPPQSRAPPNYLFS